VVEITPADTAASALERAGFPAARYRLGRPCQDGYFDAHEAIYTTVLSVSRLFVACAATEERSQ